MRRWLLTLLALALLAGAAGCARQEEEAEYVLYFPVSEAVKHGPALDTQPYEGEEDPDVEALLEALLAGPTREGLASPFPRGVSAVQWTLGEDGTLLVTFSEQYSGLADISLTLADYCVVLTLCQLDGIEGVEIRSAGYSVNYRSHQLLRPEEAEFSLTGQSGLDKTS